MHAINVGWEGPVTDGVQVVTERKSLSVAPGIVKLIDHILYKITSDVEIHDWSGAVEGLPSDVLTITLAVIGGGVRTGLFMICHKSPDVSLS
jgi:hypothetical protein